MTNAPEPQNSRTPGDVKGKITGSPAGEDTPSAADTVGCLLAGEKMPLFSGCFYVSVCLSEAPAAFHPAGAGSPSWR